MQESKQKRFRLLNILITVALLAVVGFVGWRIYSIQKSNQQKPSANQTPSLSPITPNSGQSASKPQTINDTFQFPAGTIRLVHDAAWQKTGATQMKKTFGQRHFILQVQANSYDPVNKIGDDYLKRINYGGNLKTLTSFAGPHGDLFVLKDGNKYVYLSSCLATNDGFGCSPQLSNANNTLFVSLTLDVPGSQHPAELDLTQPEDQQALSDFIAITKTIQY